MKAYNILAAVLIASLALSCTKNEVFTFGGNEQPGDNQGPGENGGSGDDEGSTPTIDATITEWDGETADDAGLDVVGTDEDFYWEANKFSNTVNIVYDGTSATVESSSAKVLYDVQGAYVTVDMLTNSVKNVEITVSGKTADGGLKIYGEKKFKLTLSGTEITSTKGPAINSQCKKRIFVHLTEGTTNRITDAADYSDDTYYLNGATADDEDRKGCFFSEGNLIFSGSGTLVVAGKKKHGIATDGYFFMRPGVTIAVTEAAKNAIHVKGDEDDNIGIDITGGLIYANVASTAGKAMKTDLHVNISGGKLLLNTSGGSEYDEDEQDTSSPSCIKADGHLLISGGELTLKSTGTGGKGISVDSTFTMTGGTVNVATSGGRYVYDEAKDLTSSPKGVKVDGNIVIDGGSLNIAVTGKSDGSEGLESKSTITINDGEVYVYAYDDAMNASSDVTINSGKVFCYAVNNDGIDSNGTLNVTGGVVISSGTDAPEGGFDTDDSRNFKVSGGVLIGTGGTHTSPSSASSQNTVIYNGISATKGTVLCIQDSNSTPVLVYELPRTMNGMSLLFSSPDLAKGSYTVLTGGTASGSSWNGYYSDGTCSGGSKLGTFTVSSTVTSVGNSGGQGGNQGGGHGPGGR